MPESPHQIAQSEPPQRSTLAYYARNARDYADQADRINVTELYASFEALLPAGAVVLDLGCGGGRDTRYFAGRGNRVIAVDPCRELLREARRRSSQELDRRISYLVGATPGLPLVPGCLDAIWACASLLHLPRSAMAQSLSECLKLLRPDGLLFVSIKEGSSEGLQDGRWFTYWKLDKLPRTLVNAGFSVLAAESNSGQNDIMWLRVIARAGS